MRQNNRWKQISSILPAVTGPNGSEIAETILYDVESVPINRNAAFWYTRVRKQLTFYFASKIKICLFSAIANRLFLIPNSYFQFRDLRIIYLPSAISSPKEVNANFPFSTRKFASALSRKKVNGSEPPWTPRAPRSLTSGSVHSRQARERHFFLLSNCLIIVQCNQFL